MTKRRIVCLCLVALLLLPMLLTGCGAKVEKTTKDFSEEYGMTRCSGKVLAQNKNYQMTWDDAKQCVILKDKRTGKLYSSTPYDFYKKGDPYSFAGMELCSPVNVTYIDASTGMPNVAMASMESLALDSIDSEKIENGVRVTYAFPSISVSIPVEITLEENGLKLNVPMKDVQENEHQIYEIALMPYLAGVSNKSGGQVMVPSGSGAIIRARNLNEITSYSEAVYGNDATEPVTMIKRSERQIYLPVFGSATKNSGMVAVIEDGASCARINATVGTAEVGYSTAYASFRVRGQEEVVYNTSSNNEDTKPTFSASIAGYENLSVRYIPMDSEFSYVGMAKTYRKYLQQSGFLTEKVESTPALSVNLLGGTQTQESFFGIPYMSDTATTTLAEAQAISKDLKELVGDKALLVNLQGYGSGGLANTMVGGGFELSKKMGSKADWEAYKKYADDNNMVLAMNYELAKFQGNGGGFTVSSSASRNISSLDAYLTTYTLHTAVENDKGTTWYLTSRSKLNKALDRALKSAKSLDADAISLGSLSTMAYSDYRDLSTTAKTNMAEDVTAMLERCKEKELTVVSADANAYAALRSDYVTEVPSQSSKFNIFSEDVPFYALVFQGYKPLSSPSINTATDVTEAYLQAVATGMTLQFTLTENLHDSLRFENDTAYITSHYSQWKEDITAKVQQSAALHDKVGNQPIKQYTMKDGVSKTVFANGVTVYVNYNDKPVKTPFGKVAAQSFVYR